MVSNTLQAMTTPHVQAKRVWLFEDPFVLGVFPESTSMDKLSQGFSRDYGETSPGMQGKEHHEQSPLGVLWDLGHLE